MSESGMYLCSACGGRGFTEDGGSAIGRAFLLGCMAAKGNAAEPYTCACPAAQAFAGVEDPAAALRAAREALAKAGAYLKRPRGVSARGGEEEELGDECLAALAALGGEAKP